MLWIGWTTLATRQEAETLARRSVEDKIAACAQVDAPIRSFFVWEGRAENEEEYRVILKIPEERIDRVPDWLEQRHPYDTPQWVAVRAEKVGENYLQWARESVK